MYKNRCTALLLAFIMLLSAFCGCSEKEPTNVTLRTASILGDDAEFEIYSALLAEFSAEHTDIYLRDTTVAAADAFRLNASLEETYRSSDAPHVIYHTAAGCFDKLSEYFVSVEEIRESYPDFASGISESAFDGFRLADGRAYCVPAAGEWTAIIINTALFEQYSIALPQDWISLRSAVSALSASGVLPFANSADDCAALLEWLVICHGGSDAVLPGLQGYRDVFADSWQTSLNEFSALCRSGAFAPAVLSDDMGAELRAMYPISSTDLSSSDLPSAAKLPESYDSLLGAGRDRSVRTDAYKLFNDGAAAMIILDSSELSNINYTNDCTALSLPSPTLSSDTLMGGFRAGFAITRRAFDDPLLRDSAVAFVDHMTSSAAAESFAVPGYLPARADAAAGITAPLISAEGGYTLTARTGSNIPRWNEIEAMCGRIYYGLSTVEQAVSSLSDSSLIWYAEPIPEEIPTLSDSDIVSSSDIE